MKYLILTFILFSLLVLKAQPGRNHKVSSSGNLKVPMSRNLEWNDSSKLAQRIYKEWASKPLKDWMVEGKVSVPRVILGHLLLKKDIKKVNEYILTLQPRGTTGSKWLLNPNGDYDFTLTTLLTILYLFDNEPKVLYPQSKEHIINELLVLEGGKFHGKTPRSLKTIKDSENHILMCEGSRYLKNRYMQLHGNPDPKFNNEKNGMEEKILKLLNHHIENGLYEFNSNPYVGYTIAPLLNLEAFGSEKVSSAARNVLDYMNYTYALGSYNFRFFPPFRRQPKKASVTSLTKDYHTAYIKTWLSYLPKYQNIVLNNAYHHALIAACMPYRPTDQVVELISNKSGGYYVQIGHGKFSSPEIYTAGGNYLLSAGGVYRGFYSAIVSRPICLFLDDNAKELQDVFHLKGKGKRYKKWNNTGVYKNFACTNGSAFAPQDMSPVIDTYLWSIYVVENDIQVAIHNSKHLAILVVFSGWDAKKLFEVLIEKNSEIDDLKHRFVFPDNSTIEYNINAPGRKWIITTANKQKLNRKFGNWPLLKGELYQ